MDRRILLHPITGEVLQPLGYTKSGRAIYPVSGGAPDPDPAGGNTGGDGGAGTPPAGGSGPTPPAGGETPTLTQSQVNALLAEERRKATEKASGKFQDYDALKAKAQQFDALQAENETTLEAERKKARSEGAQEVLTKANSRLVAAEVRAQAAGLKFRDPKDALAHLTISGALTTVKVNEDGEVDGEAVKAALTALATEKAYLLDGPAAPPPPPTPGAAGVGAGSSGTPRTAEKGMGTLRGAYAQIGTKQ